MDTHMPITSAVYPRGAAARKRKPRPERKRQAERLVERMIGEEQVASLYASLGFKRPDQHRKRRRST